jgi:hypothetical protein
MSKIRIGDPFIDLREPPRAQWTVTVFTPHQGVQFNRFATLQEARLFAADMRRQLKQARVQPKEQ